MENNDVYLECKLVIRGVEYNTGTTSLIKRFIHDEFDPKIKGSSVPK